MGAWGRERGEVTRGGDKGTGRLSTGVTRVSPQLTNAPSPCHPVPLSPVQTGSWVIEPQFLRLGNYMDDFFFINGVVAAQEPDTELWGFIDESGDWAMEPCLINAPWDFKENGLAKKFDEELELIGYIDISGEWVIEPQFNRAYQFDTLNDGTSLAVVEVNDRWGCIDETGSWVIKPTFGYIYPFGENGLAFACKRNSDRYGYIDTNGQWVIKPQFSNDKEFRSGGFNFVNGLATASPY